VGQFRVRRSEITESAVFRELGLHSFLEADLPVLIMESARLAQSANQLPMRKGL
jgi:hypothetical protein